MEQVNVLKAIVSGSLPNQRFMVRLPDGRELQAVISPRWGNRKVELSQSVLVELSPFDLTMCRIVPPDDDSFEVRRYS